MIVSRRVALFLVAFGVWSWIIWPTFLKNIWKDSRSWHDGMTAFFLVHLLLTIVSLLLGTVIGLIGLRALRHERRGRAGPASIASEREAMPTAPQRDPVT